MISCRNALILSIAIMTAMPLLAAGAYEFTYSGQLVDSQGKPKTGDVNLRISFFHPDESVNSLYSIERRVSLTHGTFTIDLNDDYLSDARKAVIFGQGKQVNIGIKDLDMDREYPQQRVTAVPYALYAERIAVDEQTFEFDSNGKLKFKGASGGGDNRFLTFNNNGESVWKTYSPPPAPPSGPVFTSELEGQITANKQDLNLNQITIGSLTNTVGDDTTGLVKDVADLEGELTDLENSAVVVGTDGKIGEVKVRTKLKSNTETTLAGNTIISDLLKVPNDTNFGTTAAPRRAVTSHNSGVKVLSTILTWSKNGDNCTIEGDSSWLTASRPAPVDNQIACKILFNSEFNEASNKVCNCTVMNATDYSDDDCSLNASNIPNPTSMTAIVRGVHSKPNNATVAINCFVQ